MKLVRRHIAFLLILAMTLTGHSLALAKAAPGPDGFIEICTGEGTLLVALDENGAPTTGYAHICPDCAFLALATLEAGEEIARPVFTSQAIAWGAHTARLSGHTLLSPSARGPPFGCLISNS